MPLRNYAPVLRRTYRYEGEGFGGGFTVTLNADGTYAFYEGELSSYQGGGTWDLWENAVCLEETAGLDLRFILGLEEDALIYLASESDAFPAVKVSDGERFIRMPETED